MRLFFYLALRNLWKHPVRSSLVGGCLAVVCALMVVLVTLTAGIKHSLIEGAMALTSGHLNIHGYYKISQGSALPLIKQRDQLIKLAQKISLDTAQIVGRLKAGGKVVSDTKSLQLIIWGINPLEEQETLGRLWSAKEDAPVHPDNFAKRGTITLFAAQARKLSVGLGDIITLALPAYRGGLTTLDLKVTAILRDIGLLSRFGVFVNGDDLREIYQLDPDTSSQIMLFFKEPKAPLVDATSLAAALTQKGYELIDDDPTQSFWSKLDHAGSDAFIGQRLEVTSWRDEIAPLAWITDVFSAFTLLVTVVLLTIVILGMIHTQTIAIHERASETGAMRAIGLSRKKTMMMFFCESLLLSTIGCLFGCLMGVTASLLMNALCIPINSETLQIFLMNDRLIFRIEPTGLIVPMMVSGLMVVVGSLIPAWRASKMRIGTF